MLTFVSERRPMTRYGLKNLILGITLGIVTGILGYKLLGYFTMPISTVQQWANNHTAELDEEAKFIAPDAGLDGNYDTKFGHLYVW